MSAKIIPKKSTVAGKIPDTADLEAGEVAINLTDAVFYAKHTDGSIVNLSGAPELHTHTISQVNNLQSELDSKVDVAGDDMTGSLRINTTDDGLNDLQVGGDARVTGNTGFGASDPTEKVDVAGDARVRDEGAMKFGGSGASDSQFAIQYNSATKSLDFNFIGG